MVHSPSRLSVPLRSNDTRRPGGIGVGVGVGDGGGSGGEGQHTGAGAINNGGSQSDGGERDGDQRPCGRRPAPRQPFDLFLNGVRERTRVVGPRDLTRVGANARAANNRNITTTTTTNKNDNTIDNDEVDDDDDTGDDGDNAGGVRPADIASPGDEHRRPSRSSPLQHAPHVEQLVQSGHLPNHHQHQHHHHHPRPVSDDCNNVDGGAGRRQKPHTDSQSLLSLSDSSIANEDDSDGDDGGGAYDDHGDDNGEYRRRSGGGGENAVDSLFAGDGDDDEEGDFAPAAVEAEVKRLQAVLEEVRSTPQTDLDTRWLSR